jgi:hypothetical protein
MRAGTAAPPAPPRSPGALRRLAWGIAGLFLGLYLLGYTGGSATTGDRLLAAGCLWLSTLAGRRILRALGLGRPALAPGRVGATARSDGFVSVCLPVPRRSASLAEIVAGLPAYAKQLLARQSVTPRP